MTAAKFEDILSKVETGPWNWLIFLLCSLWGIFGSMQALATAFLSPVTDHWCHLPHLSNWSREQIWNFSLPRTTVGGVPHHSQCEMYVRNYSLLAGVPWEDRLKYLPDGGAQGGEEEVLATQECSSWEYDDSTFSSTVISEWDLVCGRESLRSLIQSIFMLGYFFGAPLGGYFADRYGRKRMMNGALWVFILVSILGSFSPLYQLFLACRFLMAFSGTIVYQASYILAVEACTMKQRGVVGILFSVPFALGYMLLPGVSYCIREWRHLHLAISVPVIVLIANTIILPESPRWLLQNGKWTEAERELQKAARWNGSKTFDSAWLLATITEMKAQAEDRDYNGDKEQEEAAAPSAFSSPSVCSFCAKCLVFVRTPMLRRISLILFFDWLCCAMIYYGISLNSANFSIDPFLYMFLGGLMELPSYTLTIPFVLKYGRKVPLISFYVVCGVAIIVILFLPDDRNSWWFLALVMLGKFCITSGFQVIYLYCSELYPTCLRTRGFGFTSMMGRIGAIISPFINDVLGSYHWAIPSTIFGCLSVLAGVLTCLLPETNNRPLPDTVQDVERWRLPKKRGSERPREDEGRDEIEESCLGPSSTTSV